MTTDSLDRLTERQKACLRLVRDGRSTKEIAETLDASVSAIDKSIKLAMAKMGVNRRSEAARLLAAREREFGYQSLDPQSPDLSPATIDAAIPLPTTAEQGSSGPFAVREAVTPYRIDVAETSFWQQNVPPSSGAVHTLGWWQILVRVILIALASMLLAGAALNLIGSTGLIPRGLFPQR